MSLPKQHFYQSGIALIGSLVIFGAFVEAVYAAQITAIEHGTLFYYRTGGEKPTPNSPRPILSGDKVWGVGGWVKAGEKGAKFRWQCKKDKPAKHPITLGSNESRPVVSFCPNEPGPGVGENEN